MFIRLKFWITYINIFFKFPQWIFLKLMALGAVLLIVCWCDYEAIPYTDNEIYHHTCKDQQQMVHKNSLTVYSRCFIILLNK